MLKCENKFILHPIVFGILPVWKDSSPLDFNFHFEIENYRMILKQMWVNTDCALPTITDVKPEYLQEGVEYKNLDLPVQYSGAVLVAHTMVNNYGLTPDDNGNYPCFCYKVVYEYVFENGILITTIDHGRAMLRIRKNLDLKYRSLDRKRDIRCIRQFVKTSLVGDYKIKKSKKKQDAYLNDMRKMYSDSL